MSAERPSNDSPEPLVSVVTPVFNGEAYLEECIESVLRQTHTRWRHFISDNASTDRTPEIAQAYANRDERITYVRFEDHIDIIPSVNRSFALTDPASAWCKPVFADDLLERECLEKMLDVASLSPSIAVVSAYQRWGDRVHLTQVPYGTRVIDGHAVIARALVEGVHVTGNPSSTMFRSDRVLERPSFFDPRLEHADTDAVFRVLLDHDLGFVHHVLTVAREQGGTRVDWSAKMGTRFAEEVTFSLRYGPLVLSDAEYHRTLRVATRRYARYQAKQAIRPSRLRDNAFLDFHERALTLFTEDNVRGERDAEVATRFVSLLLARRRLGALVGSG
jgi:glycosyltransferase involved in cell wall biosynthesis